MKCYLLPFQPDRTNELLIELVGKQVSKAVAYHGLDFVQIVAVHHNYLSPFMVAVHELIWRDHFNPRDWNELSLL